MEVKPYIIDNFIYNGEPIVEFRLKYMNDFVDEFFITEARYTFSGNIKQELYIEKYRDIFEPYIHKITFLIIDSFPKITNKQLEQWLNIKKTTSLFIKTAFKKYQYSYSFYIPWFNEDYQRNYSRNFIIEKYKNKKYIVFCCDADEIPVRNLKYLITNYHYPLFYEPHSLKMDIICYNFYWYWDCPEYYNQEAFVVNDIGFQKNETAYMRDNIYLSKGLKNAGWHCSYFMNIEDIVRKIESFSHMELNQNKIKDKKNILECIKTGTCYITGNKFKEYPIEKRPEDWNNLFFNLN